jgi:SAM-dependent methyltransferase
MKKLKDTPELEALRGSLIQSLNDLGLNGRPILAMVRQAEPYQNHQANFVFFLLKGETEISLEEKGKTRVLGKSGPVTTLGEIAYFNKTPATATVTVSSKEPAVVFRLSYEDFGSIIQQHPDVRETLARIGEMRIIRQYHGFVSYSLFMELIGWRKDRFAINRAFAEDLENAVTLALLPLLTEGKRILEVGDGPGLICEMLHSAKPELLDNLFVQATHLEEAIFSPLEPQPSDFRRARRLKERFDIIIALQVFNVVSRSGVNDQLEVADRLLQPGGFLFSVKSQLLDVRYPAKNSGEMLFDDLEVLAKKVWPGSMKANHLIETTFLDADLDPEMEWNQAVCEKAAAGKLEIPASVDEEEKFMLSLLLGQAGQRVFDPEKLHVEWLEWKAKQKGFALRKTAANPENSFFYQLLQKG